MTRTPDFVDECYNNCDLGLLKKLTVIIPTYNRAFYLSRCLYYHAHFPFCQIIVADSSPREKKIVNRDTVKKIREIFGADILYLEYEPETEKYGGDIYRKWGSAVAHAKTEYSQICTDKEFICPRATVELIHFLDLHPDYITAHGQEYRIIYNQIAMLTLNNRHPSRKTESFSDSLSRLNDSLTNADGFANSLLLALTKTTCIQEIYQTYFDNDNPHDLRYGELFLGYAGHIIGKSHHNTEIISKIRDEITRYSELGQSNGFFNKSAESSTSRYPTYREYLIKKIDGRYYDSIKYSFETLSKRYTELLDSEIETYFRNNIKLKSVFTSPVTSTHGYYLWNAYMRNIQPLYHKQPQILRNIIECTILHRHRHTREGNTIQNDMINKELLANIEVSTVLKLVSNTECLKKTDESVMNTKTSDLCNKSTPIIAMDSVK